MIEPLLSDEALLADIDEARRADPHALHVWWLGQSGFLACVGERSVLFDPYLSDSLTRKYERTEKPHVRMSRRVIEPGKLAFASIVTSTHGHTDHLDAETLAPIRAQGEAILVAPEAEESLVTQRWGAGRRLSFDAGRNFCARGVWVYGIPAAHPTLTTDDTGHHKYLGYVVRFGGFSIYHAGDGVAYDGQAEHVQPFGIDLAILPINGKVGNMNGTDAARLAKAIGAKLVVPCHYHLFEFNTAEPEELFVPECERIGQAYRVLKLGERLTLEAKS